MMPAMIDDDPTDTGQDPTLRASETPGDRASDRTSDRPLDRRDLFVGGATLVAGAALAACGTRAEPKPAPPPPKPSPNAKAMAEVEAKAKANTAVTESLPAPELADLTFADLQARMAAGTTPAGLIARYAGCLCSPASRLSVRRVCGTSSSSSSQCTTRPAVPGEEYSVIMDPPGVETRTSRSRPIGAESPAGVRSPTARSPALPPPFGLPDTVALPTT